MTAVIEDLRNWKVHIQVDKYEGEWSAEEIDAGLADGALYDSVHREDNLLLIGGASVLWQALIGNGTGTAGQELTFFNNGNAAIGVGDSTTAEADTQTELQAATNHLRKGMDATYPLHTDSDSTAGAKTITFRSTFGTSEANFAWQEWILKNSTTSGATGRALNRKVVSLGTKTSSATWQFTVTITAA